MFSCAVSTLDVFSKSHWAAAHCQLGTSGDSALELEPFNSSKRNWEDAE